MAEYYPQQGWYVFRVAPKREGLVRQALTQRGFIALAPYTKEFERVSRQRIIAYSEAVFPRYVFAEVGGYQWDQLRSVPHLHPAPLCMGGKPFRLSVPDIKEIALMGSTRQIDSPRRPKTVAVGTAAKIKTGALAGQVAKVGSIRGKHAELLLQLLGSLKAVKIPLAHLEAA